MSSAPDDRGPTSAPAAANRAFRAARWLAPGASQTISSIGNSLLAIAAARWMSAAQFGLFMLGYTGVLLVSQLFRVAVGEAGLLSATNDADRAQAGPKFLGSAVTITPILGLLAFGVAELATRDLAFAVATGCSVAIVSSTEVARYSLLSRQLVKHALRLDIVWTLGEFGLLVVFRGRVLSSPSGLLWCWTASAACAALPAYIKIGVARPLVALRIFTRAGHWWRLTANDALVSATSYLLLAILSVAAGTRAVGAVRASMLPFQWVQLSIASAWLVVLSRRPSPERLARLARWLFAILLASIAALATTVQLIPPHVGRALLRDNWQMTRDLVWYSALVFSALTLSEIAIMRLKAAGATSLVLASRLAGSFVIVASCIVLAVHHTPITALAIMSIGQLATALFAIRRLVERRSTAVADTASPLL